MPICEHILEKSLLLASQLHIVIAMHIHVSYSYEHYYMHAWNSYECHKCVMLVIVSL